MFGGIPFEIILGIISSLGGFLMKMTAQRQADHFNLIKLGMENAKLANENANSAAERSSPVLRKIIAITIILICFGGLLLVAYRPDIPVSIIEPMQQKEFLWGLFKWGSPVKVITAQGFVLPEWVKFSVITVVSFLFGTGAAKVQR
jgi:hypothetical protein